MHDVYVHIDIDVLDPARTVLSIEDLVQPLSGRYFRADTDVAALAITNYNPEPGPAESHTGHHRLTSSNTIHEVAPDHRFSVASKLPLHENPSEISLPC